MSKESDAYAKELDRYEREFQAQQSLQQQANSIPYATAMFANAPKANLVEWQLDFKDELEDIQRFLRCDVIGKDRQGNLVWVKNPDEEAIVFNERGVNDITREIRMFLNKNKVLSNYGLEEIKPRIRMIGHELRMLIYNNYEKYGIDNEYKMCNYSIMVLTLLSMIEDSYRRAINGEERKDLNQARIVNQNEPIVQQGYPQVSSSQGKSWLSKLNPFR
jgi:hypothetical protein